MRAQARRRLEVDLREALAAGAFTLHYQPLLDLAPCDCRLRGVAALAARRAA